jgi:hypothetical protein
MVPLTSGRGLRLIVAFNGALTVLLLVLPVHIVNLARFSVASFR